MIAVIFEVRPAPDRTPDYLAIAADMRKMLDDAQGFVSVERFQSLTDPDKLLSLSFFKDQAAITAWRQRNPHRQAQSAGRDGIFVDYRLRIAPVIRDYGMFDRTEAPPDSRAALDGNTDAIQT